MSPLLDLVAAPGSWSEPLRLAGVVALKSTVVLALSLSLAAALGRRSSAARHLVLALGLAGALAVPFVGLAAPPLELPLLPSPEAPVALSSSAPPPVTSSSAAASRAVESATGPEIPPATFRATTSTALPAASDVDWGRTILVSLVGVSLLSVLYLGIGILLVHRLARRSTDLAEDPEWSREIETVRRRLGIRRPVALRMSEGARVPLTFGVLRPAIIVPSEAEGWTQAERRVVLLHELGHVARWDWPIQVLARLACALHWYNPLSWIACRRLLTEAERACDDIVLTSGESGPGYAKQLLELATRRRAELPVFGAVAMARRATLSQRIQAILDPSQRRGSLGRRQAAILSVGAALVVLLIAPARLVRGAAEVPPRELVRGGDTLRPVATADEPEPGPDGSDIAWEDDGIETVSRDSETGGDGDHDTDIDTDGDSDLDLEGSFAEGAADAPPLLVAVARGDVREVRRLLDAGANPNQGAVDLGTPLIAAAIRGDAETVRLLLDAGASPDLAQMIRTRRNELPRSPLGAAARSGDPTVVRLLLDAGADPTFAPRGDANPLMIAARHGHDRLVGLLLSEGADPNAALEGDGTPLIAAAEGGDHRVVRQLLAAGADPDLVVEGDGSPLIAAVRTGNPVMVSDLLSAGADPDRWVDGDECPLFHAVASGQAEIVRQLLDAGADPNAIWPGDGTPLIVATRTGDEGVVRLLVDAGARPDLGVDGDGNALIAAAAEGRTELVRRMLASGADPNAAVRGDGSPLIAAAREGHLDTARTLVEAGADVDLVVPGDENPLIQAAGEGHLDVVRYLLDTGADPSIEVTVARWDGHEEVRSPLLQASREGHREIVELLRAALSGAGPQSTRRSPASVEVDDYAWLIVDPDLDRMVVPEGAVVEIAGAGHLEFPAGSTSIAIPAGHTIRANGEPLGTQAVMVSDATVEIVAPDGLVAWRLRVAPWSALDGPGTRIEDRERRRPASVDSRDWKRFYLAVDEDGGETFFEPAG